MKCPKCHEEGLHQQYSLFDFWYCTTCRDEIAPGNAQAQVGLPTEPVAHLCDTTICLWCGGKGTHDCSAFEVDFLADSTITEDTWDS
jgi:hypothetical protein